MKAQVTTSIRDEIGKAMELMAARYVVAQLAILYCKSKDPERDYEPLHKAAMKLDRLQKKARKG